MTAFKLTEVKSDIFQIPQTYSLAHAVSADLNTTKKGSLAWQFSVIFGQVDELSQQLIQTGNVAALEDNSRFIYFMVTKQTLYEKPTYDTLQSALICLREHMHNHEVSKLAMPHICCGTDGLEWQRVKKIIRNVFANEYNVEILVCQHVPPAVPFTPKCQIVEVKGNLFTAPASFSLVHSVSADFAMCAGIGLQFKCKFGQLNDLIKQNKHTGNVAVLKDHERYIYNLITKERHHERCTYAALYYALTSMREHMHEHNVTKLAIPRLGCGIDRLNWVQVKKIFEYVFGNDKIEIIAYFYDPPAVVPRGSIAHAPSFAHRAMASQHGQFKLSEVEGDLFSAPNAFSLAHCVGADFGMGAGIAVKFKQIYGQVEDLLSQGVQSGSVAVLKDKERYIYYLVTKPKSWDSPTYDSLRSSLTAMRDHMCSNQVSKLAIPRIGCGIDGLEWDKVSAELHGVFDGQDVEIVVYNFVPK